jgi:Plasmid pRiA4b ORF-3-like protein
MACPIQILTLIDPYSMNAKASLNQLVSHVRTKFQYIYDFGDDWIHDVVLERILPADPEQQYPVCLVGKRNCPPEDVGGIWGYADFFGSSGRPRT